MHCDSGRAEAALRFLESHRMVVGPGDCDALGHMNVQHYFRVVSEGMFWVMEQLGLGPIEFERRRRCYAVVRTEADFRRELRVGESVVLDSTIRQMGEKLTVFHHRLRTVPEVAMTLDYMCVLMDLDRRRAVPVPDDIRSAALALFPNL